MDRDPKQANFRHLMELDAKPGKPPQHLRLTTAEASQYLSVKPRTLKKWRHERRISYYRLGHVQICFDLRDLDAFLARRRVEAIG